MLWCALCLVFLLRLAATAVSTSHARKATPHIPVLNELMPLQKTMQTCSVHQLGLQIWLLLLQILPRGTTVLYLTLQMQDCTAGQIGVKVHL